MDYLETVKVCKNKNKLSSQSSPKSLSSYLHLVLCCQLPASTSSDLQFLIHKLDSVASPSLWQNWVRNAFGHSPCLEQKTLADAGASPNCERFVRQRHKSFPRVWAIRFVFISWRWEVGFPWHTFNPILLASQSNTFDLPWFHHVEIQTADDGTSSYCKGERHQCCRDRNSQTGLRSTIGIQASHSSKRDSRQDLGRSRDREHHSYIYIVRYSRQTW